MLILGIQDGHNAGASLIEDGKILSAVQEERLSRYKNQGGFPANSICDILEMTGVSIGDIDFFVYPGLAGADLVTREDVLAVYFKKVDKNAVDHLKLLKRRIRRLLMSSAARQKRSREKLRARHKWLPERGVAESKICHVEHHICHAAGSYYGWGDMDNEVLVLSCDAAGDELCATVNIGKGGKLERIAEVSQADSVPYLYGFFTFLMGFVPLEHEYKLMGLAPYSMGSVFSREVADYLWGLFEFTDDDKLGWRRQEGVKDVFTIGQELADFVKYKRFDALAGGVQLFTEEFFTQWVRRVIAETGIKRLALGGGLFMNVKLNKQIMELDEVEDMFVFPSCGDETNCIGAAWAKYAEVKQATRERVEIPKLGDFYLGGEFDDGEVKEAIEGYDFGNEVEWEKYEDIEKKTAELLSEGNVVARCKGRMEFGARALGNRSILAPADNWDTVRKINEMIKKRDFWMPFAPSVLAECAGDYVVNRKDIDGPYMIMAYETRDDKFKKIIAGTHPYDKSCRAQFVHKEHNGDYHRLISYYRDFTGEGAILNTSFNLHGYPIVYRPVEAIDVFAKSGLDYLALGSYLLSKKQER
jgi:carbamoyltransferase